MKAKLGTKAYVSERERDSLIVRCLYAVCRWECTTQTHVPKSLLTELQRIRKDRGLVGRHIHTHTHRAAQNRIEAARQAPSRVRCTITHTTCVCS